MTSRRTLLIRTAAATAGAAGIAFGSGAFTQVEADRQLSIGIDPDDQALLAIEPNADLVGDSAEIDPDTGEFVVDLEGGNPGALLSLGALDDLDDPESAAITEEAFDVRARSDDPIDLTVSLGDTDGDSEITLLLAEELKESDTTHAIGEGDEVDDLPELDPDEGDPADRVFGAIHLDSAAPDELDTEITVSAEILDGD